MLVPLSRVPPVCEAQVEALHQVANNDAHLKERHVLADTVRGSERERHVGVAVVHERLARRHALEALSDEPPLGEVRRRVRKVAWVVVHGPEVDADLLAWGDVAGLAGSMLVYRAQGKENILLPDGSAAAGLGSRALTATWDDGVQAKCLASARR